MTTASKTQSAKAPNIPLSILERFRKLNEYQGEPNAFWKYLLDTFNEVVSPAFSMIATRLTNSIEEDWKEITVFPSDGSAEELKPLVLSHLNELLDACQESNGLSVVTIEGVNYVGLMLPTGNNSQECLAVFHTPKGNQKQVMEKLQVLMQMQNLPLHYQLNLSKNSAVVGQENLINVLDMMILVNEQDKYLSCVMTFCNELNSRFQCDRVSIGWIKKGYIKLQSISGRDEFEKKMDAIRKLELAMEEACDQDAIILYPALAGSEKLNVYREHEKYAKELNVDNICSVPLYHNKELVGICTLERAGKQFQENELRVIKMACDQVTPRLQQLKSYDKWIGALIFSLMMKRVQKLFSFRNSGYKLAGIFLSLALLFICFVPVAHRVEGPLIIRTNSMAYVTSPLSGHIESVLVGVGDKVDSAQTLMELDRNELLLKQAATEAEMNKFEREIEKAQARMELADMRIAEAQFEQSQAQLKIIERQLELSAIKAPFRGVIVDGDQKERIGSPVKQGDMMFKISRVDSFYVEIEVPESDIQQMSNMLKGEIALTSKPHETLPMEVSLIEPSAVSKTEGNVFIVQAKLKEQAPEWWRPGMTGVAKIDAGEKTLLWIFTHKTMDFLRLQFWW